MSDETKEVVLGVLLLTSMFIALYTGLYFINVMGGGQ